MLLSKAKYNCGIHKVINLEEANRQKSRNTKSQALFKEVQASKGRREKYIYILGFRKFRMKSSSVERDFQLLLED